MSKNDKKLLSTTLIVLLGLIFPFVVKINGLSLVGIRMLGITIMAALLWMTEAIPIGMTGLVIIFLQGLYGIVPIKAGLAYIAHPVNAVVLVGFLLAETLVKSGLDKRISLTIISKMGQKTNKIMLGIMIATAFLSMWMSNTATTAIMVPIVCGILAMAKQEPLKSKMGRSMIIGIAFAANIGGMGTPTGTPANPITMALLEELANINLNFIDWMIRALPFVIVMIPISWLLLLKIYPHEIKEINGGLDSVRKQLKDLGKLTNLEKHSLVIFISAVLLWLLQPIIANFQFLNNISTEWLYLVAVFITIISIIPKIGTLTWKEAEKCIGWDVLFLVGGGLSMGKGLKETGVINWIASLLSNQLSNANENIALLIIIAATALGIIVFCSLSGTATTFVPIAIGLALTFNWDVTTFAICTGLAASFAFMLPANAAPNAVAYGSGFFETKDMVKVGIINLMISIIVLGVISFMIF